MGDLLAAIIECFWRALRADQELAEESRFGDTPEQRANRRAWEWGSFLLLLIGGGIALVLEKWT